jgi:phosphoribosyl 1,2-cyclic phosphate phosphodiesterase
VQYSSENILIDCGPDLRQQSLQHNLNHLDGVLLTHAHYDHTGGMDDLRPFLFKRHEPLPLLMSKETLGEVTMRHGYFIDAKPAKVEVHLLEVERGERTFKRLPLKYFSFYQGNMKVNGFRFGNLAYVSDIKEYPESLFEDLAGVDTLILSALRYEASPLHLTVDEAISLAESCRAKKTYLTHISHELDHEKTEALLPPNVRLAYDGLELIFEA